MLSIGALQAVRAPSDADRAREDLWNVAGERLHSVSDAQGAPSELSKRKRKRLHARIEELDLEKAICDGLRLSD